MKLALALMLAPVSTSLPNLLNRPQPMRHALRAKNAAKIAARDHWIEPLQ